MIITYPGRRSFFLLYSLSIEILFFKFYFFFACDQTNWQCWIKKINEMWRKPLKVHESICVNEERDTKENQIGTWHWTIDELNVNI